VPPQAWTYKPRMESQAWSYKPKSIKRALPITSLVGHCIKIVLIMSLTSLQR